MGAKFWAPHPSVFGPLFGAPPLGAPPFGDPLFGGPKGCLFFHVGAMKTYTIDSEIQFCGLYSEEVLSGRTWPVSCHVRLDGPLCHVRMSKSRSRSQRFPPRVVKVRFSLLTKAKDGKDICFANAAGRCKTNASCRRALPDHAAVCPRVLNLVCSLLCDLFLWPGIPPRLGCVRLHTSAAWAVL